MTSEPDSPALPLPDHFAREPIPGYVVIERIGAGGYGEVWKAEAPGGLTKAIKLVYGHLDDERAVRELKSLNRIKEVRHPFLLSLERIEAVEGHLVIVSELADSNLKEQFDECQAAGMPGIPRDRLIPLMRDAADALDFLCEDHGLQHLDVKPENLLLVGGHIKVADFGLVKELDQCGVSMMGGLTPSYAPPEIFDGRPTPRSDQYSLAIVFQEMLTGALPFGGRTAAQLAAQHLHSRPRLDDLCTADRNIIARALAKDPAKRFASCREFVAALEHPAGVVPSASSPRTVMPTPARGQSSSTSLNKTMVVDDDTMADLKSSSRSSAAPRSLAPVDVANVSQLAPTLFIGVGGTAGVVMQSLRQQLETRLGDLNRIPAIQMLLLDTDRTALAKLTEGATHSSLDAQQTLAMPLRPTQEYRERADMLLASISRRWLYNVPRSLQTEGMRPLGRLAFIDNFAAARDRIYEAVTTAADPATVSHSNETSSLPFSTCTPRIYMIGSIAGGAGSGMLLDLTYAVRQIAFEAGLTDESVVGVLTHSTPRAAAKRDLAIANSLCFLTELNQFSQPAGHYPGESACDISSSQGRAFHHTYFAHLGDDLDQAEYEAAAHHVADFLFQNTASRADEFFASCRNAEGTQLDIVSPDTSMRTFGLRKLGHSSTALPVRLAEPICRRLVEEWRGAIDTLPVAVNRKFSEQRVSDITDSDEEPSTAASVQHLVTQQTERLGLNSGRLATTVHQLAVQELGREPDAYLLNLIAQYCDQFLGNDTGNRLPDIGQILNMFDTILGTTTGDVGPIDATLVSLRAAMAPHLTRLADERGAQLQEWCYRLADDSRHRVRSAQSAALALNEHLQDVSRKAYDAALSLSKSAGELRAELSAATHEANAPNGRGLLVGRGKKAQLDPRVSAYFHTRLNEVVMHGVTRLARLVANVHVALVGDRCRELLADLGHIASVFSTDTTGASDVQTSEPQTLPQRPENDAEIVAHIQAEMERRQAELTSGLEERILKETGLLSEMLACGTNLRNELPERLGTVARNLIHRVLSDIDVRSTVMPADDNGSENGRLQRSLADAMPRCVTGDSGKRLLVVLPEAKQGSSLENEVRSQISESVTIVYDDNNELVFCYEVEGVPMAAIGEQILDGREDLARVAERLHARTDIDWSSLEA